VFFFKKRSFIKQTGTTLNDWRKRCVCVCARGAFYHALRQYLDVREELDDLRGVLDDLRGVLQPAPAPPITAAVSADERDSSGAVV
jgi:hypothetical protein